MRQEELLTSTSNGRVCWSLGRVAARSSETISLTMRTLRGATGPRRNKATVTGRGVSAGTATSPRIEILAAAARCCGVTG